MILIKFDSCTIIIKRNDVDDTTYLTFMISNLTVNGIITFKGHLNIDCMFLSCHVRISEWIQTLYGQFGEMVECSITN